MTPAILVDNKSEVNIGNRVESIQQAIHVDNKDEVNFDNIV